MVVWRIKSQGERGGAPAVPRRLRAADPRARPRRSRTRSCARTRRRARGCTPSPTGRSSARSSPATGRRRRSGSRSGGSRARTSPGSSGWCSRRPRDLRGLPAGAEGAAVPARGLGRRARTRTFAEIYAREQYGRRQESVALWVVPRDALHEIDEFPDEFEMKYRRVDGYSIKARLQRRVSGRGRSTWRRERRVSERTTAARDRRRRADPRLAQLGVDGHRAVPRGGRRVLVDRAERDRPRARALRARRRASSARPPTSSRSTARPRSTAARRSSSCAGSNGRGRSRGTGSTRPRTRSGSRRSRPPTTPRSPGSRRRWTARRSYHRMHAEMWVDRLLATDEGGLARRGGRRALAVRARRARRRAAAELELASRSGSAERSRGRGGRARRPRGRARRAVGGDDDGAALGAGRCAVVTEDEVWEALAEIPDPEIPVDLARRPRRREETSRSTDGTRARRLHADVHGLPRARRDARRDGGEGRASSAASPTSASASTTRGRPTTSRPTGREKLRAAGFAPPAPRGRPERSTLVQLQRGFRCPYCGSTEHEAREPLRPDAVPLDPLLRRTAGSRSSSSRRSDDRRGAGAYEALARARLDCRATQRPPRPWHTCQPTARVRAAREPTRRTTCSCCVARRGRRPRPGPRANNRTLHVPARSPAGIAQDQIRPGSRPCDSRKRRRMPWTSAEPSARSPRPCPHWRVPLAPGGSTGPVPCVRS